MSKKKSTFSVAGTLMEMTGCATIGVLIGAANFFFKFSLTPKTYDHRHDNEPIKKEFVKGRRWMNTHVLRRDVYTTADNGTKLHGNLIPSLNSNCHRYAICVHGYADSAESMGLFAKYYHDELGMNVLLPDLRGHGGSDGSYVGMGYPDHYDLIRWVDYILEMDPKAVMILHGVSMGAATVMMTTGEVLPSQVLAAVEDCGYTSAMEEFVSVYNNLDGAIIPAPLMLQMVRLICLVRAHFDLAKASPINYVRHSQTPTLFIHGEADNFVPSSMMPRLYAAASCTKEFLWVPGADHVNSVITDSVAYWAKVEGFLHRHAPAILEEDEEEEDL